MHLVLAPDWSTVSGAAWTVKLDIYNQLRSEILKLVCLDKFLFQGDPIFDENARIWPQIEMIYLRKQVQARRGWTWRVILKGCCESDGAIRVQSGLFLALV